MEGGLAAPLGMWDLGSLTKDPACAACMGSTEPYH